jgi:hypothetical protein
MRKTTPAVATATAPPDRIRATIAAGGALDRILRTPPAVLVGLARRSGRIGGWTAVAPAVVAGMPLLASLLGACGVYDVLAF